jgi:hypothetical protein
VATTSLSQDRAEVTATLFALHHAFEDLIVRGLEATGRDDVRRLDTLGEELGRAGASYLAGLIAALVHAIREDDHLPAPIRGTPKKGAARALLRAQTAARVFERVLSLDAAAEAFGAPAETAGAAAAPAVAGTTVPDRALVPILDELAELIEGLIGSGLTTASKATLDKLGASFKEASRLKLLRLATSLRYVSDECSRFLAESEHFSARRLAFFANRTWLLARGLRESIDEGDHAAIARLLLQSTPQPMKSVTVVVIGVQKRALLDGSAAFEFRMRTLGDPPGVPAKLVWSCVFGARPNVPAEAFLHLPQAQKFNPKILLDGKKITITDAAVTADGRVMLGPKSTVTAGAVFDKWAELVTWDKERAIDRIRAHAISPLDLEVELQEEIVVTDYELGAAEPNPFRSEQQRVPLRAAGLELDAVISTGPDGEELRTALGELRKAKAKAKPPLYGLVHYEMARLVFQPLTALAAKGPRHLMISSEKIDLAALMKTLDFRT